MKGLENPEFLAAWAISNIAALVILWAAVRRPNIARALLFLLFAWASWANYTTVHQTPEVYLEYASMSIEWYSEFILGWFSSHIVPFVTAVAAGQALIAVGMLLRGWWVKLACLGTILFLVAIAPLGVGAGFPFSLTVSIAAWLVFRKNDMDFLWRFHRAGYKNRTETPALDNRQ